MDYKRILIGTAAAGMILAGQVSAADFEQYCLDMMGTAGGCSSEVCMLKTETLTGEAICVPRPCDQILAQDCPLDFCAKMINCRGQEICHFQMFDPPECGNLSYAGQDVPCCDGLVRRCGVAFLDDTCDMYGDNSEYSLPICIPCGDGFCTNFENVCNCPEDCWPDEDRSYEGWRFDEEL